ncbi:MAG: nitrite reductase [Runella sp.]
MSLPLTSNISEAAKRDILDLQKKIDIFRSGEASEEAFRKFRLARGVYGQRQPGVQMIRIKLPYGRLTADQLIRIADCSDRYATGNLHATTRQDIQLHYVKLADTPALWAELEDANITLREACGNTVRNVTASATAGIDPEEPFDVSPYAHAIFEYFLRNPICQDMGRKFKIALSSSEKDSAYTFMHDVGLIPRIVEREKWQAQNNNLDFFTNSIIQPFNHQQYVKGFKVFIGGGLGAQPQKALVAYEFLEADKVIPFIEAVIRVFDRYGERVRRHKARMKFLLADLGRERFMELVNEEKAALKHKTFDVEKWVAETGYKVIDFAPQEGQSSISPIATSPNHKYQQWLNTNVFEQKQKGWYAVQLRVLLGDMHSDTARQLAEIVRQFAADDIRVTVNQGYLLRFIKAENLPIVFEKLDALGLAEPGFDSTADITTCPGTDTCNLAISSSYGITRALETMMKEEFPELIYNNDLKIKISGCMNGCGQHSAANIGFHGSSLKNGKLVLPALQVILGGGFNGKGEGMIGDKILKIPSKRGPAALRLLLHDYENHAYEGEYYNDYFLRQGDKYFYALLKPLTDLSTVTQSDYIDWDHDTPFQTEVGVGECASVLIDLVGTTLIEAQEKLEWAHENLQKGVWADAIYHAYNVFVTGAKAMLVAKEVPTNTQYGIVRDFDAHFEGFIETPVFGESPQTISFKELVFSINKNEPSEAFAAYFVAQAEVFLAKVNAQRQAQLTEGETPTLELVTFGMDS